MLVNRKLLLGILTLMCTASLSYPESVEIARQRIAQARTYLAKVESAGGQLPIAQRVILDKGIRAARKHCDKGESYLNDRNYNAAVRSINTCIRDAEKSSLGAGLAIKAEQEASRPSTAASTVPTQSQPQSQNSAQNQSPPSSPTQARPDEKATDDDARAESQAGRYYTGDYVVKPNQCQREGEHGWRTKSGYEWTTFCLHFSDRKMSAREGVAYCAQRKSHVNSNIFENASYNLPYNSAYLSKSTFAAIHKFRKLVGNDFYLGRRNSPDGTPFSEEFQKRRITEANVPAIESDQVYVVCAQIDLRE